MAKPNHEIVILRTQVDQLLVRVEGMKAHNAWREMRGEAQAYGEKQFNEVDEEMGQLILQMRRAVGPRPGTYAELQAKLDDLNQRADAMNSRMDAIAGSDDK